MATTAAEYPHGEAAPAPPGIPGPIYIDTQHEDFVHDAQMDYYGAKLATCSSGTFDTLTAGGSWLFVPVLLFLVVPPTVPSPSVLVLLLPMQTALSSSTTSSTRITSWRQRCKVTRDRSGK